MQTLVNIHDSQGNRLYMNLIDDGSGVYRFASGWGFVTECQITANCWQVVGI